MISRESHLLQEYYIAIILFRCTNITRWYSWERECALWKKRTLSRPQHIDMIILEDREIYFGRSLLFLEILTRDINLSREREQSLARILSRSTKTNNSIIISRESNLLQEYYHPIIQFRCTNITRWYSWERVLSNILLFIALHMIILEDREIDIGISWLFLGILSRDRYWSRERAISLKYIISE